MKTVSDLVAEHPFFAGLPASVTQVLAGCGSNAVYPAGTFMMREGTAADTFHLIRHGAVALEIYLPGREALVVETLNEGDILGWSWLAPPYRWSLDARAVQLTRAVSLDAKCLRGKMDDDHELGYELYKRFMPIIQQRLQAGRLQLIDMYGVPAGGP
jgi:CRP-like cAMP-binding protein